MSVHDDPFNPYVRLGACACGRHVSQAAHDAEDRIDTTDPLQLNRRAIETAVMRAIFPDDGERRRFLRAVGRNTALAALSQFVPFGALEAMAQEPVGVPEKKDLKIGYLPITCASPIIIGKQSGYFEQAGLNVELLKTPGWALVRDKTINGDFDAAQMLAPMPLAISMGAGSAPSETYAASMDNLNGSAITLSVKHKNKRDPRLWKDFRLAIPFDYSIHNYLLRAYLVQHGVDPDHDVQLRVMAPPDMLANLASGNIDGFIVAEPFNQRAVFEGIGFIHLLTLDLWRGHPCCTFAVEASFVRSHPNTFAALYKGMLKSAAYLNVAANRDAVVDTLSAPQYLNQPKIVIKQVLTGTYADGLGNVRTAPDRIAFQPFPWPSMAVWILTQMKRWGYVKGDVNYKGIAEKIYLATDARKAMKQLGMEAPSRNMENYAILGELFDPLQPERYLRSLPVIGKT
ncbi:MAG: nitrate ABC transporter substrate-binding protein [Thiomonas sp. 13-66-29]|jgi:nitrate/nitrite transport system substrate-binding protein|uniref:ABC transporter nitrate-binding protein n=1 Tax=Thiomonas delicata TaxID=364030 RepID=A0A238D3R0_THIDL|nr:MULTISPECIES: CmpA/NrtA family ABC transporter substrate-binding protein [Thiomonas]MDE2185637.1 ABC transporter substrate-binding protein [Betaproteobacteria bacterium]OZB43743.1 MAG: nitrate ABC transporter substrate-binding protein [Thiomonas sp. 15-66-11]OZB58314.1 MAG: nitrate ABC transporter substrate-binding protein [Thiomonas sp. 13-66-29]SBP87927.1 ABC transporter nitrate-binding protein [Thiomonas delicata]